MNHETEAATEERPVLPQVPSVSNDPPMLSESQRAVSDANAALAALQQQAWHAVVGVPQPQPQHNVAPASKLSHAKAIQNHPKITSSKADALLQMRITLEQRRDAQEQKYDAHASLHSHPLPTITQPVLPMGKGVETPSTPSKQR
jgi:hypothetical protein